MLLRSEPSIDLQSSTSHPRTLEKKSHIGGHILYSVDTKVPWILRKNEWSNDKADYSDEVAFL